MTASERRIQILYAICERKHESVNNLAFEFNVTTRTIKSDLLELSRSYPIYTTTGKRGGVHIMDGYRFGTKYLSDEQVDVLMKISKNLKGEELKTVQTIISTFRLPKGKGKCK